MEHETPDVKKMGGCMLAGDLKVKGLKKQRNILLVGDTRVGKSSLFNYLRGLSLRAKATADMDIQLVSDYSDEKNSAYTYCSVTLVPNVDSVSLVKTEIQPMKINNVEYSLVDMPGFYDESRDFVGVFGVSYMLEKVMSSITEVKWILVIEDSRFGLSQLEEMIKPYLSYLTIFNIQELIRKPNLVEQIAAATTIVVSKSQQKHIYYERKLQRIIKFLQQNDKKHELNRERKIILQLLKSIYSKKRIDLFPKLSEDQVLQSSNALSLMNDKSREWISYNFSKSIPMQYVIQLPFTNQFLGLSENDKQSYAKFVEGLNKKFEKSIDLLKKFVDRAVKNWHSETEIDYSNQYMLLDDIIKDHPYGSIDLMMQDMNIEMPEISETKVVRIDLFLKLNKIQEQISELEISTYGVQNVYEKISKIREVIQKILVIFREAFCNKQIVNQFVTFICIFRRYLIQAEKINLIDKHAFVNTPHLLQGCLNKVFQIQKSEILSKFLENFVPLKDQNRKFQKILVTNDTNVESGNDVKIKQIELRQALKKSKNQISKKNYKASLRSLIRCYEILMKCKQYYAEAAQRETYEQSYSFNLLLIFKRIAICLESLNEWINAIKIYEKFSLVSLTIEAYQKFIQVPKATKIAKFENMLQYSKFLKSYGKKADLIKLYERMMDQFIYYPNLKKKAKQLLILTLNKKEDINLYIEKLQNIQDEWDIQKDELNQIIEDIKDRVLSDSQKSEEKPEDEFFDIEPNEAEEGNEDQKSQQSEQDEQEAFKNRKTDLQDQKVNNL